MSRPQIFIADQISQAIHSIRVRGGTPTKTTVRAQIGGGNHARIKRLIEEITAPVGKRATVSCGIEAAMADAAADVAKAVQATLHGFAATATT